MNLLAAVLYRRRGLALLLAGTAFLACAALGIPVLQRLGGGNPDFVTPGSPTQDAVRHLEDATGTVPDGGLIVLVDTGKPFSDAETTTVIDEVAAVLDDEGAIAAVQRPEGRASRQVAEDGSSAYVVGLWDAGQSPAEVQETIDRVQQRFEGRSDVLLGGSEVVGNQVVDTVVSDLARAEVLAFPVLLVLSLVIFRGVVAALVPLLLGGLTIVLATAGLRLLDEWTPMSIFAMNLVTALGLGLAIDYSLLMISRFRDELATGAEVPDALRVTMSTAGRTVLVSAVTVALAMACLLAFQQRFLYSMAAGGVLVALSGIVAALVVLPALMALLGRRIDALAPRRWRVGPEGDRRWHAIARGVMSRPLLTGILGVLTLLALALPLRDVGFTAVSAKDVPAHQSAREVDEILASDYATNPREDIVVLVSRPADAPATGQVMGAVRELEGVAGVAGPLPLDGSTSVMLAQPAQPGMDRSSLETVREIRDLSTAGTTVEVAGESANTLDLQESILARLPLAVGLVLASTVLVLWLLTGSVVLPLLTVLMNTLTLAATYGILVLIFQDGHLSGLLDFESQGALDTTMPVLLFALVFGLSTDYGVFLLARMGEARAQGAGDREAVVLGVGRTGRIVTAAAVLFCVALGALVTSEITFIKALGLGTALGVLIDATLVRILLVPSLVSVLGRWAWWSPGWLARIHDVVGIREGGPAEATR